MSVQAPESIPVITVSKKTNDDIERFKTFTDHAPYGMGISDLHGNISYVNQALADLLGYSIEEIVSKNVCTFHPFQEIPKLKRIGTRLAENENVCGEFLYYMRKDGSLIPALISISVIHDELGTPQWLCTSTIELTGRTALEHSSKGIPYNRQTLLEKNIEHSAAHQILIQNYTTLRESEELFRQMAETVDDIIWIHDVETGKLSYVNKAIERITGYPIAHFYDEPRAFSKLIHKDDLERVQDIKQHLSKPNVVTCRFVCADKTVRWIRDSAFPINNSDGKLLRIVGIATDITQAKLKEQQLLLASKMSSLGTLVSGIAHEINNPNNLIMLSAEILSTHWEEMRPIIQEKYLSNPEFMVHNMNIDKLESGIQHLFESIINGSERIREIVSRLRDFVHNDTDDSMQVLNINDCVRSALKITDSLIKKNSDNFKTDFNNSLPLILGNYRQLQYAIVNLITNACHAMTEGSQSIVVTTGIDKLDGNVIVTIEDTGCGISEVNKDKVFDPFFTTWQDRKCAGLGLSVSYTIIRYHNGSININSTESKGTTVTVSLNPVVAM